MNCDFVDPKSIINIIETIIPDEIYNLGGETDSFKSIQNPLNTLYINGVTVMSICETIKQIKDKYGKSIKLIQAGSTDIYNENISVNTTDFYAKTPYSISKILAYWTIRYYREKYDLKTFNVTIPNTESVLRRETYITKKIAKKLSTVSEENPLTVGNIHAMKDWMHASDVASALNIIMKKGNPGEFIISTGKLSTVKDLINVSFDIIGVQLYWNEEDQKNIFAIDKNTKKVLVRTDPKFLRDFEAKTKYVEKDDNIFKLGWKPKYTLKDIMKDIMN